MKQDIKNLHLALQSGSIRAVIFDLDGVLVTTDNAHYLAWKRMADEEGIYFDRTINERLRGVSRMESLAIILERADKTYTEAKKIEMATRKNEYYKELICSLTSQAILPGALAFIDLCRTYKLKIAIGSSSKNTKAILAQVGLANAFDAIADGNDIKQSKPAPDVFLTAAEKLGIPAQDCIVVEDADAGVQAASAAGMRTLAVGYAAANPAATWHAPGVLADCLESIGQK